MELCDVHERVKSAIIERCRLTYGEQLFRHRGNPDTLLDGGFGLEWRRTQRLGQDGPTATRRSDRGVVLVLVGLETDNQDEALIKASELEASIEDALQQTPENPCSVEGVALRVGDSERRVIGRYLELSVNIEAQWTRDIRPPA